MNPNLVMIPYHKCYMVLMVCATLVDPLNSEELVCFKCHVYCEEVDTGPAINGDDKQDINGNTLGSIDTVKVPPKNNEGTNIESSVNISHQSMTTVVSKTSTTKAISRKYIGRWNGIMDMAEKGHVKLNCPDKLTPPKKQISRGPICSMSTMF